MLLYSFSEIQTSNRPGKLEMRPSKNVIAGRLLYVINTLNNRSYLVDFGAQISVMPPYCILRNSTGSPMVSLANGTTIRCYGTTSCKIKLGNHVYHWTFYLTDLP